MKNEFLFNKNLAHDSGIKHVSGLAEYTDDISEPLDTLYGAIGWSKKAHAKIKEASDSYCKDHIEIDKFTCFAPNDLEKIN